MFSTKQKILVVWSITIFNLVEESKDPIVEIESQDIVDETPAADSTNQVESVTEEKKEELKEVVEEEKVTANAAVVDSEPVKEEDAKEGKFIFESFESII